MMKVLAGSVLGIALSAALAAPSMAATSAGKSSPAPVLTDNITSGGDDGSFKAVFAKGTSAGTFTTMFDFTIPESTVMASVTTSFAKYLSLTVFEIQNLGTGAIFGGDITKNGGSEQGTIASFDAAAGNYAVIVNGSVTSKIPTNLSQNVSFSGDVAISTVPLPTSVAMFGVALAGLGVAGAIRRKTVAKASA